MLRQALASLQGKAASLKATAALLKAAALLTTAIVLLNASTAFAQDLDVSSIAKDDVKKEATKSGSWLPSLGSPSSSSAPAVASSTSTSWYDPFGLFTGEPEPEQKTVRRNGTGVVATYQGSTRESYTQVKTTGGVWWDPLEVFYQSKSTVEYEDVNGFLNQPRVGDY